MCRAQNMVVMEFAAGGTLSSKLATDGVGGQPRRFGWCAPALSVRSMLMYQLAVSVPFCYINPKLATDAGGQPRRFGWSRPER